MNKFEVCSDKKKQNVARCGSRQQYQHFGWHFNI